MILQPILFESFIDLIASQYERDSLLNIEIRSFNMDLGISDFSP